MNQNAIKIFYSGIIMLVLLLTSVSASVDIPRIEPYVNDFVGLMSAEQILELNLLCDAIEQNTTYEIAVVTISGTGGQDRVEFAGKIGDFNGVGKKDLDNGIIVLWSMSDDYGGAIATGRGSESILNDAKIGTIGRDARPLFDEEKYYEGITQIVNDINDVIIADQNASAVSVDLELEDDDGYILIFIGIATIAFLLILGTAIFGKDGDSNSYEFTDSDDDYKEPKKYTRRKGKNGRWRYYVGTGKSYSSAAYALTALALLNSGDNSDDYDDDSNLSFSPTSFGGGSFGGGGAGS